MSQQYNYAPPPMSAPAHVTSFAPPLQPHSRQSSGAPTPNFSYPPPPRQTPPANGGYAVPPPPTSPPRENSQPIQPPYYAAPPASTSSHFMDEKTIARQNEEAFDYNASLGKLSISPPTVPSAATREGVNSGAPGLGEFLGAHSTAQDDVGTFNGGSYRVSHRNTNSVLTVQLAAMCPLVVRPGAMISMSPSVTIEGQVTFNWKKLIVGGNMKMAHYKGPGEVLIAPDILGDILVKRISKDNHWKIGRDAFLAHTAGVHHEYKSQGITKGFLSGEGIFVYEITGEGLLWMSSFGAIIKKELADGEKYWVDRGHLVAWNCEYVIRNVSGGLYSGWASGEYVACCMIGPGTVYFQTRKLNAFATQMKMSSGA